jgi:hypothetical protein
MKRILIALLALALLLPAASHAAPQPLAWQVFTMGNGLIERESYTVAPDRQNGVWVGHVSGGRGIYRRGGLTHIRADGSFRQYHTEEPFVSCSSVDALATTADGWTWMWLSGYHDYGHNDHTQACAQNYGISGNYGAAGHESYTTVALGVIAPDGTPQMLPKEQIPADITWGMVTDRYGRVWVGVKGGLKMRNADGTWSMTSLWDPDESTTAVRVDRDGTQIAVGSASGLVGVVRIIDFQTSQTGQLRRPSPDTSRPVADLTFTPASVAAAIGDTVYVHQPESDSWGTLPLPSSDYLYGQRLAYTAGRLWVSAPVLGLRYLDRGAWTPFPTDRWPLGRTAVNDLQVVGGTQLLMATDQGALLLNTSEPLPDPSGAQRAFDTLWQRTNTAAGNSWVWGPKSWDQRYEPYVEGPGGSRYVRYYDKSRMELNDPGADPNAPWYVTNGLLVVELVRGKVQLSNDPQRGSCPVATAEACPSYQQVAGDLSFQTNRLAPRYNDFTKRLDPAASQVGQRVAATLSRQQENDPLAEGQNGSLATAPTTIAFYDGVTGHNVPQLFRDFMQRQPVDALFAFGRPITEPYWVRTELGGKAQWIMVQLFERRVLTYTPGNAPDWQVEMGNVGQHYFQWRYPGG